MRKRKKKWKRIDKVAWSDVMIFIIEQILTNLIHFWNSLFNYSTPHFDKTGL